jgi:hypothetical protein
MRKAGQPSQRLTRLQDEVYREMLRLEGRRPGAEMGLALSLLRAWVASNNTSDAISDCTTWLRTICPICLKMIEESLEQSSTAFALLLNRYDTRQLP